MRFIFRGLYFLRCKSEDLVFKYRVLEINSVYPNKIKFPKEFGITQFPEFHFDASDSQLIFNGKFHSRGKTNFVFINNGKIEIGKNTFFNRNCSINALDNIQIGDDCLLGENVSVYDHNHKYKDRKLLIRDQGYTTSPVKIGNNCWIGSNVIILKGVTIGANSIIGANCVIHKDVPESSLVKWDTSNQIVESLISF